MKLLLNKYLKHSFFSALALSALVACGQSVDSKPMTSPESTANTLAEDLTSTKKPVYGSRKCVKQPPTNDQTCYTDTFQQPVDTSRAVDILFVLQTSAPLDPEKAEILADLNSFIANLPEGGDYNIAVMLAHGSTSTSSGVLFKADTEPAVLRTATMTDAQIQSALTAKFTNATPDADSGGGEEGLYSLFRGITTPALLADSQAAGFFRPAAALGVVFISDRRDICAVVPPGVPAETDPLKIAARIRDCEGLTAAGLTNRLKLLKGQLPVIASGLIYTSNPASGISTGEIGYGYTEVINLTSGVAIDLATGDIPAGLSAIANLAGGVMVPQNSFTLTQTGVDPASIKVQVNGQDAAFQFSGNVVTVQQSIPGGAVITINYCLLSTTEYKCTHYHGRRWHTHVGKQFYNHCIKRHGPDYDGDGDHDDKDDAIQHGQNHGKGKDKHHGHHPNHSHGKDKKDKDCNKGKKKK